MGLNAQALNVSFIGRLEEVDGRPAGERLLVADAVAESRSELHPVPQLSVRHLLDEALVRSRSQDLSRLRLP